MSVTGGRWIGVLAVVAVTLASGAGGGVPDASAATHAKKRSCVRAQVAGKKVCLRRGTRCNRYRRSAYLEAGFDCVKRGRKRVLVRASPAAVRQGRYIALPPSGEPTFRQALAAFDSTVAALPGVRAVPGSVGTTDSGTAALRWLYDYRDRLTRAQLAVLNRALTPGPDAQTVNVDGEGTVFLNARPPVPLAGRRARVAALDVVETTTRLVPESVTRLKARGVVVRHPVTVSLATSERPDGKPALMDAWPAWLKPLALQGNSCLIKIYPQRQESDIARLIRSLLHELTHCAQYEFMSSSGEVGAAAGWVLDGTAEYVATTISQEWTGNAFDFWLGTWLRASKPSLFTRAYDGVGFWALLAQSGANVFQLIGPLVRAGSALGAYNVGVAAAGPRYAHLWGTTLSMVQNLGADWNLQAPGAPRPALPLIRIHNGGVYGSDIAAKGASVFQLELAADVLHVTSTHPDVEGLLRDSAGADHVLSQELDFCLRPDACECPDAPDPPEASYPRLPRGTAYLGYANQRKSMALKVTGEKLECDDEKRAPAPGGGGGGGGGRGGLQIRQLDPTETGVPKEPELVGTIRSGKCSFTGRGFRAQGRGGGYRFTLRLPGARRPGQYQIPRGSDTSYLHVTGRGGPYSSNGGPTGQGNGGVVIKRETRYKRVGKRLVKVVGYRISVGMTPLYGSGKNGIAVIPAPGGLKC